jgi:hypothetical protein
MIYSDGSADKSSKKAAFMHNLISTSYHEAGHTVYALLHFMIVDCVEVFKVESDNVNGFTHFNYLSEDDIRDSTMLKFFVESEVCVHYAGLIAERHHFKTISGSDKLPMFLRAGSSKDIGTASKLIKKYNLSPPGNRRYRFKKKMAANILKELKLHWQDVNLVAHGLFKKKRLYFSDLQKLLTTKSEFKDFWKQQFKMISHIYKNLDRLDEFNLKIRLLRLGKL